MKFWLTIVFFLLMPMSTLAHTELVPLFMEQSILAKLDSFELFTKTKDIDTQKERQCVNKHYTKALVLTNTILNINKTDGRSIPRGTRVHDSIEETAIIMAIKALDQIANEYTDAIRCVSIDSPALTVPKAPPLSSISTIYD